MTAALPNAAAIAWLSRAMLRAAALLALLLATPAFAQDAEEPSTGGAFIGRIYRSIMPSAPETPTADFVRQSRPGELDYRPFDPTADRSNRRKPAEEMARVTARLEAAAAANRRKAARVKIPD